MASYLSVSVDQFSDSVRVPRNCLEGIWCKAVELLNTKDAIVSAPGVANGKLVLSVSGKKPHLVTARKGGAFSCDSDCPNWKAMGICSHSVAVAEVSCKLSEFVDWYKKSKKIPNLTKFAEATMPKGRGRKGCVASRKRKSSIPVQETFENPSFSDTHSSNVKELPLVGSSDVYSAHISMQTYSPTVTQNQYRPCGLSQNMFSPSYPVHPHSASRSMWPSPQSSFHSFSPQFNFSGYQPGYQQGYQSCVPHQQPPSSPFVLSKITGNISVCAGCRNKYPKNPSPPDNFCIKHQEWREYTPSRTQNAQKKFGNVYYHFTPQCVWLRCAWFIPSTLEVPSDIYAEVTDEHIKRLNTLFNIDLPSS